MWSNIEPHFNPLNMWNMFNFHTFKIQAPNSDIEDVFYGVVFIRSQKEKENVISDEEIENYKPAW